jgi:predicted permease
MPEIEPRENDWRAEVDRRVPRLDDARREELAQHLCACYEEARAAGLSPHEARDRARRELDGWREPAPARQARRAGLLAGLRLELRGCLRALRRAPGFTATVVALFALGLGSATTLFSLVEAVLLRPYPFHQPERLVLVWEALPQVGFPKMPFSPPDFEDLRREQRSFEGLGALANRRFDLSGAGGDAERVVGARTSPDVFGVLGVAPLLGRVFDADEDRRGERLAVLSYGLWQRRFGGDTGVVGRRIALDRVAHTVVGVMPASFRFPLPGPAFNDEPADLWVPLSFGPEELGNRGGFFNFSVVARLRDGVDLASARAEMDTLAPRVQANYPARLAQMLGDARLGVLVAPLRDEASGPSRRILLVLLAAGGVLLAVACANAANLLLGRAVARGKDLAVRAALGASRLRLLRQPLVEALVLAAGGGALGVLLAAGGVALLPSLLPNELPLAEPLRLSAPAVAVALLLALACAAGVGATPALLGLRADVQAALHDGRGTASPARRRVQAGFVVAQIALALVLLVGAGLLGRSLGRLLGRDPGFRPDSVLALAVTLPPAAYPQGDDVRGFCARLVERLGALPAVEAVGASTDLPLAHTEVRALQVEGRELRGEDLPAIAYSWVAGRYLHTLGVELVAGRLLDERDGAGAPPVVVVSASTARRLWPGEDPLGRRLRSGDEPWMTVVGVVGDVLDAGLLAEPRPHAYSPLAQEADERLAFAGDNPLRTLHVTLRSALEPADLAGSVRRELRALDPEAALVRVRPLRDDVRAALAPQRAAAVLLGLFAAAAALLAAVGLYGALAYQVTQRRREFGLRLALGAGGSEVARLVTRSGLRLVGWGLALGLPAAWVLSRSLGSFLFELTPHDPPTYALTAGVLVALAALATSVPSWRAARVDPLVALREE